MDGSERRLNGEDYYRILTENMVDVVWVLDVESMMYTFISPSVERLLGYTPEETMAVPLGAAMTSASAEQAGARLLEMLARFEAGDVGFHDSDVFEIEQVRKDGSTVWTEAVTRFHRNKENGRLEVWGVTRDISERRRQSQALAESEEHYRLLAENSSDVILRVASDGTFEYASPSTLRTLKWAPSDLIGKLDLEIIHPDDLPWFAPEAARLAETGEPAVLTYRFLCGDGSHLWVEAVSQMVPATESHDALRVVRIRDVDAQHRAYDALARSEELFRMAMESSPLGMAVLSTEREFVQVNPALCRMVGRDEGWLLQHRIEDLLDLPDIDLDARMRAELLPGPSWSMLREHQMVRSDGTRIWVEHAIAVVRDRSGLPVSFVSQFADVTLERQAREQLRFLATHDPLTSLLNRRELLSRLEAMPTYIERTGSNVGVLFVDLDRLKEINDTYGHEAGDIAIQFVATKLVDSVRENDIVARIGGDEFVVVLPGVGTLENAEAIAHKIEDSMAEPVDVNGTAVSVSVSVGVALSSGTVTPEQALANADKALYAAKQSGRARVVWYSDDSP